MTNKRNIYWNLVKGVAILLVLLGHSIQYGSGDPIEICMEKTLFKFIYGFHMPLFMLISGYFFFFTLSKNCITEILKRTFYSIIIPLCVFSLISFTLEYIILKRDDGLTHNLIINYIDKTWWFLWFLWVVIYSQILILISKKLKINRPLCHFYYHTPILLTRFSIY